MKRIIISLLLILSASPLCAVALDSQKVSHKTLAQNENISDSLLKQLLIENPVFSKSGKGWKPKSEIATNLKRQKINSIKCNAAFYKKVIIVTVLGGKERMKQIILKRTHDKTLKPVYFSSHYKRKDKNVIHKYRWGTVVTYKSGIQEIKVK